VYLSDGTLVTTTTTLAGTLVEDPRPTRSTSTSRPTPVQNFRLDGYEFFRNRVSADRSEHQHRKSARPATPTPLGQPRVGATAATSGPLRDLAGSHRPISCRPRAFHPDHAGRSAQRGLAIRFDRLRRAQRGAGPWDGKSWFEMRPLLKISPEAPYAENDLLWAPLLISQAAIFRMSAMSATRDSEPRK